MELERMQMPHCVLVVEDDDEVREAIADLLTDRGYKLMAASNGRDALDQLSAVQERPCVILLDLMMPVMNGWQFRAAQQTDPDLRSIPVIVFSASAEAAQASQLGVAAFLRKPLSTERLLEAVSAVCAD